MGTHYHLILEAPTDRLSAGMQYLNGVYAQRFNKRHDRGGHVFGGRFASWSIRDDEHYERAVGYVLANPVQRRARRALGRVAMERRTRYATGLWNVARSSRHERTFGG